MGDFIPTPYDQEIVARLNYVFDTYRSELRTHNDNDPNNPLRGPQNKPLFFPGAKLSRIARRIGAYPVPIQAPSQGGTVKNPRARWHVFLDGLPVQTQQDIITVITAAQAAKARVVFDLTHEPPTATNKLPYVVLDASTKKPVTATLPNNEIVYCLTLVCQDPIPEDDKPSPAGGTNNNPSSPANKQNNEVATKLPWQPDDAPY
ncbi:MAG: hypothetical protein E7813_22175 [Bradyrhizobium sp.]|uniref:hypothetical protein n=1 Tax=Bradyrhizobium sp. TaxID=376 RepID=UPI0011F686B2|nr:hypothetical protein [Bradyrhizobium sp.]THD61103.1 MAG: hypothetical protein E7813_22175 [Bradyrhizobium sp.]